RYYSSIYNGANLYSGGIAGGGDIVNTTMSTTNDIGIGAQWNLGTITTPTTLSYHVAFTGEVSLDLDANDTSGSGTSYFGLYQPSGPVVAIVDSDAAINNIIGDLNQITIALTNAQAGDQLTVSGVLPSGITASGGGGTAITLSGVATEAD